MLAHGLAVDTHWLLCQRCQADTMPKPFIGVVHVIVADSGMTCHSVVPDTHGTIIPFDADLQISRDGYVLRVELLVSVCHPGSDFRSYLEQELKKRIGLLVFQADDTAREAGIDVQSFLTGGLARVSNVPEQIATGTTSACREELTGCTRTIGWLFLTGSLRTNLPSRLAFSACLKPSCSASSPSSRRLMGSERRS